MNFARQTTNSTRTANAEDGFGKRHLAQALKTVMVEGSNYFKSYYYYYHLLSLLPLYIYHYNMQIRA